MTYSELKKKHSDELNAFPMFFAFSNKQFDEGMKKLGLTPEDKGKLCKIPGGGFIRKEDATKLSDMFAAQDKEMKNLIASDTTGEGFIYDMLNYELANHEYCITMDFDPALNALGLTREDIANNPALLNGLNLARKNQWNEDNC
jgi:hypothetical protein